MSADLLYSLGLDISDFKTSAKATKESADDIKRGLKGFKEVIEAGGVAAAVFGFFSGVIDYAQNAKGKLDENTSAVKRFGDALKEGKETVMIWGAQLLGVVNRAGEGFGLIIRSMIDGYEVTRQAHLGELASTEAARVAREKLNAGMEEHNRIVAKRNDLEKAFNDLVDQGLTKQETVNNMTNEYRLERAKLAALNKGSLEYQAQELKMLEARNNLTKSLHDLDKENYELHQKSIEETNKTAQKLQDQQDARLTAEERLKLLLGDQAALQDVVNNGGLKGKELADARNQLAEVGLKIDTAREDKAKETLELATLLLKPASELTGKEQIRLEILQRQTTQLRVNAEIADLTGKLVAGTITPAERERLAVLIGQAKAIDNQLNDYKEMAKLPQFTASDGSDTRTVSDARLDELRIDTMRKLSSARQARPTPGYANDDHGAGFIETRLKQLSEEIYTRQQFRATYAQQGEGAFKNYSAADEDRLRRYITPEAEQQAKDQANSIKNIDATLRRLFDGG
ncbi:MAG: hypothetical protein H7343_12275 [Undibacterium sp.]|nr:hypothetical protein [Opitutaceae bacterium]